MSKINGINVTTSIVPGTTDDIFPTHLALYGKGGWRTVETLEDLNEIPEPRLEVGMSVYVAKEEQLYILKELNPSEHIKEWKQVSLGGGGDGNYIRKVLSFFGVVPQYDGEIIQYVGPTTLEYTNGYFYKSSETSTPVSSATVSTTSTSEIADPGHLFIDKDTFEDYVHPTEDMKISFVFHHRFTSDDVWRLVDDLSVVVDLSDYGITAIGEPNAGDIITVDYVKNAKSYKWTYVEVQDISGKIDHFWKMPEASEEYEDLIVQYIGKTDEDEGYINGYFYKGIVDIIESSANAKQTKGIGTLGDITVDTEKFEEAIRQRNNVPYTGDYVFEYDGINWYYENEIIDLEEFGISYTGTASSNDEITVEYIESSTSARQTQGGETLGDIIVDTEKFEEAISQNIRNTRSSGRRAKSNKNSQSGDYIFIYDGQDWYYNEAVINLVDYGISFDGIANEDDEITVTYLSSSTNGVQTGGGTLGDITVDKEKFEEAISQYESGGDESETYPLRSRAPRKAAKNEEENEENNEGPKSGDYIFTSDGYDWYYKGEIIELEEFGIEYTGFANPGDEITVTYTAYEIDCYWKQVNIQPEPEIITNAEIDEMWS